MYHLRNMLFPNKRHIVFTAALLVLEGIHLEILKAITWFKTLANYEVCIPRRLSAFTQVTQRLWEVA